MAVAAACGYRRAYSCATTDELAAAMREALDGPGPVLLHLPIRPGALSGLGRPTVTPAEVAERFRSFASAAPRQVAEALR